MPEIKDGLDRRRFAAGFDFPRFMRFKALSEGLVDCDMRVSPARRPIYAARFNHKLFIQPHAEGHDARGAEEAVSFIEREIRPGSGDDFFAMNIFCPDPAFLRMMKEAFGASQPAIEWREAYSLEPGEQAFEAPVPRGFALREVSRRLLGEGLANSKGLEAEMTSERPTVDDFLAKGFGICAVKGNELAGWCLSEYNCSSGCEVGVEVAAEHRHKGLALAMVSAFVKMARSNGYARIGWDCHRQNAASWHTAIRAGFTLRAIYPTIFICKDKAYQFGANGNIAIRDGDGDAALMWYKKAAATGRAPYWVFINMAQVQALTGDIRLVMEAYEGLKGARYE